MNTKVLVRLDLLPYGNYSGSRLFSHELLSRRIANIMKKLIKNYGNHQITFWIGEDINCRLKDFELTIIDDNEIIDAYQKLISKTQLNLSSEHLFDYFINSLTEICIGNKLLKSNLDLNINEYDRIIYLAKLLSLI